MSIFINLKELALTAKSKKLGKVLNKQLVLHYDQYSDSVSLCLRDYKNNLLSTNFFTTYSSNKTYINLNDSDIKRFKSKWFTTLYGIKFVKAHNPDRILDTQFYIVDKYKNKYIYIKGKTELQEYEISDINPYKTYVFDKEWKRDTLKKANVNIKRLTALHNIVPFSDTYNQLTTKEKHKPFCSFTQFSKFIIDLKNPNINNLHIVRKFLYLLPNTDLQALLKKVIHNNLWQLAKMENKVKLETHENKNRRRNRQDKSIHINTKS